MSKSWLRSRLNLIYLFGWLLLTAPGPQSAEAMAAAEIKNTVAVVRLHETLTQAVAEQLSRALLEARYKRHPALFIELDTYGGFEDATSDILQLVLSSDIPVIVWTPPGQRAHRAGSLLLLSAHYSAMASSATAGAQTYVATDPEDSGNAQAPKKILVSRQRLQVLLSEIAEKRGKDEARVRALLDEPLATGAAAMQTDALIDGVHETREAVWAAARVKFPALPENPEFAPYKKNTKELALGVISDPNVSYGLLALGALGIYAEITRGGLVFPGAAGAVALAVGALSMRVIPIRPMAILLLVVGLLFLAVEMFTPLITYGVMGLLGGLSLFFSGFFLVNAKESDILLEPAIWIPIFLIVLSFMVFLSWQQFRALRSRRRGRSINSLVGKVGIVKRSFSADEALVQFAEEDEYRSAKWHPQTPLDARTFKSGGSVVVKEQHGFVVYVS